MRKLPPRKFSVKEALKLGHIGVVGQTRAEAEDNLVEFDSACEILTKAKNDLLKICPATLDALVCVDLPAIILKLIVPAGPQGSLIPRPKPSAVAAAARGSEPGSIGHNVEDRVTRSAIEEAEEMAREAAQVAIASIRVADRLVREVEDSKVSLETASQVIAESPDGAVTRKVYARSNGPERKIDFMTQEVPIGGGHNVPAVLSSKACYALKQCFVTATSSGRWEVIGQITDPEWQRLRADHPRCRFLSNKGDVTAIKMIRAASAFDLLVDIEVCAGERISNRYQSLLVTRFDNMGAVIAGLRERFELIEEEAALQGPTSGHVASRDGSQHQ